MADSRLLAIDVGAGTQDILVHEDGIPPENCNKLVMPSRTIIVGRRIRRITAAGRDLFLTGTTMGGGASSSAIRDHLAAGLRVYATPLAAKTVRDDLAQVRDMGVEIVDDAPLSPADTVITGDVDLASISMALSAFDLTTPTHYAIAVQDHGECPTCSQREFRFRIWREFIQRGGRIVDLAYAEAPGYLNRMGSVQSDLPGAVVMDTAGAAIWGALQDERVSAHRDEGLIIVNVGNEHALAVLLRGERVWGLFEHHTGRTDRKSLRRYVNQLREGILSHTEVYDGGGHGCHIDPAYRPGEGFAFTALTGPNWALADGLGYSRAAPHGDMMIAGCYGLVAAAKERWRLS